jgi:hypothetical protein
MGMVRYARYRGPERCIAEEILALEVAYRGVVIGNPYALQIENYPYHEMCYVVYNKCCPGHISIGRDGREGYLVLPTASDLVVELRTLSPKRKFSWKKSDPKINFRWNHYIHAPTPSIVCI